ncbi:hypothetical protein AAG906_003431 [Vitis piasezkii]
MEVGCNVLPEKVGVSHEEFQKYKRKCLVYDWKDQGLGDAKKAELLSELEVLKKMHAVGLGNIVVGKEMSGNHKLGRDKELRWKVGSYAKEVSVLDEFFREDYHIVKAYFKYRVTRTKRKKKAGIDPIRTAFDQMKRVKNPPIQLRDFASVDSMREEINEVVAFLQNPSAFQEMGARAPRRNLLLENWRSSKPFLVTTLPKGFESPPQWLNLDLQLPWVAQRTLIKISLTKPFGVGGHSENVSLVNLVVLQTRFQFSKMRLKGIPAKAPLVTGKKR